jgi:hypothetical protein
MRHLRAGGEGKFGSSHFPALDLTDAGRIARNHFVEFLDLEIFKQSPNGTEEFNI